MADVTNKPILEYAAANLQVAAGPFPAAEEDPSSYAAILRLSFPLILSMAGYTVMQILDGLFLTWYSEDAVAAQMPAVMCSLVLTSLFTGAAAYTSTFVAQYKGANRPYRIGAAVWQGIWFSLIAGAIVALASLLGKPVFHWAGHAPHIMNLEIRAFQIFCWGAPAAILVNALSGFFSGRGDVKPLMFVQIGGQLVNAILAWIMIFGRLGLAPGGVIGGTFATMISQILVASVLLCLFLRPRHKTAFATLRGWRLDPPLFLRLLRFGLPAGLRAFVEMLGWASFSLFVGRLGTLALAATNIAFRINMIAWMPLFGLSTAVGTLVGQAQGRNRPDLSARCTWRGVLICQLWMLAAGLVFVAFPRPLISIFHNPAEPIGGRFEELSAACTVLLRFVALYCLLDGFNVIFMGALQGAGDTRWTLGASSILFGCFVGALAILDHFHATLYMEWTAVAAFVMILALVWLARFHGGRWRSMRVIEPELVNSSDRAGFPVVPPRV